MDPVLEKLWNEVVASWEDDKLHGKLVGYAQSTEQLATIAGLYRKVIDVDSPFRMRPEQVLDAKKRLDGIVLLAQMSMDAERQVRVSGPPAWIKWAAGLFLLVALVVLGFALISAPARDPRAIPLADPPRLDEPRAPQAPRAPPAPTVRR